MHDLLEGDLITVAAIAVASIAVTASLTPVARLLALRFQIVDSPKPGKMHSQKTPYLGGTAIAVSVLGLPLLRNEVRGAETTILLVALMICLVGFIDDWKMLGPMIRLGIEACAAAIAVQAGAEIRIFGNGIDSIVSGTLLVVLTNSFNLLDNMDGYLASVAIGVSVPLTGVSIYLDSPGLATIFAATTGSCLGFLFFNWHPAKIFMGDAGSLLIGFVLVSSIFRLTRVEGIVESTAISITATSMTVGIVLLDTSLVVLSRIRSGRSILRGGTDHMSHRLHRLGLSVRSVAASQGFLALLTSSIGCAVLLSWVHPLAVAIPALILGAAAFFFLYRQPITASHAHMSN